MLGTIHDVYHIIYYIYCNGTNIKYYVTSRRAALPPTLFYNVLNILITYY